MTESPAASSDDSGGENDSQPNYSKATAGKDKECQYCHQYFTSSSLGRHLDQFISKKKPDGIHNVDEIRRLRGGITRRTARNTKREHQEDSVSSTRPSPAAQAAQSHQQNTRDLIDKLNAAPPGGLDMRLNRLNWQSTGVISDPAVLNASSASSPTPLTAANPSASPSKKRSFSTFTSDLAPTTLADTARALELSLREVLDSLRSATKHLSPPPPPFDFDVTSQSFPALCLRLLPTPPTLFQPSPFSTIASVPISAPGPDQLAPLRTRLTSTIDFWKWNALRLAQPTASNVADEADFLSRQAASYAETALNHLDTCYQNWITYPPEIRDGLWHIELLRAFQSQKEKTAQAEEEVERIQQESNHLQQQVDQLSQCQWPREMALWPPERKTFGKKTRDELRLVNLQRPVAADVEADFDDRPGPGRRGSVNMGRDKWDFDKLVNKWKLHVREDRSRRGPWLGSQGLGIHDGGMAPPGESKRAKMETDALGNGERSGGLSNGFGKTDSPVNGIVTVGSDGRDSEKRPVRAAPKNINIVSDF